MFMRFALRFYFVLALAISLIACNRPAQQAPPATPAEPATQAPSTPPAAEPGKTESAPRARETSPAESASQKAAAPKSATPKSATPQAAAPKSSAAPAPEIVEIPAGTTLTVAMIDAVGTDTSKAGDTFMASVAESVVVNGKTVLPKGMKVRGRVVTVDEP